MPFTRQSLIDIAIESKLALAFYDGFVEQKIQLFKDLNLSTYSYCFWIRMFDRKKKKISFGMIPHYFFGTHSTLKHQDMWASNWVSSSENTSHLQLYVLRNCQLFISQESFDDPMQRSD